MAGVSNKNLDFSRLKVDFSTVNPYATEKGLDVAVPSAGSEIVGRIEVKTPANQEIAIDTAGAKEDGPLDQLVTEAKEHGVGLALDFVANGQRQRLSPRQARAAIDALETNIETELNKNRI
jgi:hypothetical protein